VVDLILLLLFILWFFEIIFMGKDNILCFSLYSRVRLFYLLFIFVGKHSQTQEDPFVECDQSSSPCPLGDPPMNLLSIKIRLCTVINRYVPVLLQIEVQ